MNRDYSDKEKLNKRLEIFETSLPSKEKLDLLDDYKLDRNLNLVDLVFECKNIKDLELKDDFLEINSSIKLTSPNLYQINNSLKSDPVDLLAIIENINREEAQDLYKDILDNKKRLNNKIGNISKDDVFEHLKHAKQYSLRSEDILKDFNIIIDDEMYQKRNLEIDTLEKAVDLDVDKEKEFDNLEIDEDLVKNLEDDFPIEKYGGPELWFYKIFQT